MQISKESKEPLEIEPGRIINIKNQKAKIIKAVIKPIEQNMEARNRPIQYYCWFITKVTFYARGENDVFFLISVVLVKLGGKKKSWKKIKS